MNIKLAKNKIRDKIRQLLSKYN